MAFAVHSIIGGKEFRYIKPTSGGKAQEVWVQSLSGWHWVSMDLLLAAIVLITIGASDLISSESTVLFLVSGYFFLCGLAWLGTIFVAGKKVENRYVKLTQWLLCFLIAGLAFLAR